MTSRSVLARVVDSLLEGPIAPSFTRLGYDVRSRTEHWRPLDSYQLDGRVVIITGPTSGLGLAAATQLAECGATLVLVGRDRGRTERVRDQLPRSRGAGHSVVVADLSDLASVRAAAAEIVEANERIDVLIHNAGALGASRHTNAEGIEVTVAAQVVGQFLLTSLLLNKLRVSAPSRVITVSSGGMYSAALTVDHLEMGDDYRGTEQYARAKRAQVTLNEMWAARFADSGVVFQAMHPGWADTPGVEASLPTFRKVVGPLLRSPQQGADTMVWLAADDDEPLSNSGGFWLDRHLRSIHKLPSTRRSDTAARRTALWEWCVRQSGIDPR